MTLKASESGSEIINVVKAQAMNSISSVLTPLRTKGWVFSDYIISPKILLEPDPGYSSRD